MALTRFRAEGEAVPDELVEIELGAPSSLPELFPHGGRRPPDVDVLTERRARDDLRRQIARLEARLAELFASAFPRKGLNWGVGAAGGPRVLGVADLERVRDALVVRLRESQAEIDRRSEIEERNRGLLESMIVAPERFPWVRISNEDVGEPGCSHWHSRPRWGLLGMLAGWWRVKLSSGCPLAGGRAAPRLAESA
jgi:hypothetical protein